jgi:hypothetical protein
VCVRALVSCVRALARVRVRPAEAGCRGPRGSQDVTDSGVSALADGSPSLSRLTINHAPAITVACLQVEPPIPSHPIAPVPSAGVLHPCLLRVAAACPLQALPRCGRGLSDRRCRPAGTLALPRTAAARLAQVHVRCASGREAVCLGHSPPAARSRARQSAGGVVPLSLCMWAAVSCHAATQAGGQRRSRCYAAIGARDFGGGVVCAAAARGRRPRARVARVPAEAVRCGSPQPFGTGV